MESIGEYTRNEGMPFLERAGTPGGFADWLIEHKAASRNLDVIEALAYSLVLDGRSDEAVRWLGMARTGIGDAEEEARKLDLDTTRQSERAGRIDAVPKVLRASPDEAVELLRKWSVETASRLRAVIGTSVSSPY